MVKMSRCTVRADTFNLEYKISGWIKGISKRIKIGGY